MKTLVQKMSSFGILKVQLIIGAIVMVVAMIAPPVAIMVGDASLIRNPYVLGVVVRGGSARQLLSCISPHLM